MVTKTALQIVVGLMVVFLSVPPVGGASFTLSDAALMSLDWNQQDYYGGPIRSRILERRDIPGPGVEFDIFFAGNTGNNGLFFADSSSKGGSGALIGQNISAYNSYDQVFTLLSVNGQPTTNEGDYIAVGAEISLLNSTSGYRPYGLDLRSGTSYPNQVLAQTNSNDTQIRLVGFTVYLLPFTNNHWSPSGTTLTLLVAPAPGTDPLYPKPVTVTLEKFSRFAAAWLQEDCIWPGSCGGGDWNADGYVDLSDFAILSEHWMRDPSLMTWWRFDGDYADSAGNYPGTPVGDPAFVGQALARVGSGAVELNGNNAVVVNDFMGLAGTAARTCMAWIKTTGTAAPIVYWGDKNTAGGMWEMRLNSNGQLRAQMNGCGINGVSAVNTGQWVHVAAVLPEGASLAADVQLYVNGVREAGTVTAGTINTKAGAAMRIGANETGQYFTGLIDDVRVYDRALTAEEIQTIAGM